MIEIVKVQNKSQLKKFVQFGIDLYKGNDYFVPPLVGDEIKMFTEGKSPHLGEDATAQCFLAYKDGKIVARCAGIISHLYNKKNNAHRVRITRFDSIDDQEVSNAILSAVEEWGRQNGCDTIHGPLDFNDLGREGMLVEGFDKISTFETQYNYPYYQKLWENLGYVKDVDWLESQITIPQKLDDRNAKLAGLVEKRLGLHEVEGLSKKQLIDRYYDKIFDEVDEAYDELYSTIPLTERVRKDLLLQFKLVIDKDFVSVVVDKDDNVVAFGLAFPSINKAVKKSNGKLFPFGWIRILRAIKNCETIDLALIGVGKKYQSTGATAIIFNHMLQKMLARGVKIAETNPQLENNLRVHQLFKNYDVKRVRRRRCFVKSLINKQDNKQTKK